MHFHCRCRIEQLRQRWHVAPWPTKIKILAVCPRTGNIHQPVLNFGEWHRKSDAFMRLVLGSHGWQAEIVQRRNLLMPSGPTPSSLLRSQRLLGDSSLGLQFSWSCSGRPLILRKHGELYWCLDDSLTSCTFAKFIIYNERYPANHFLGNSPAFSIAYNSLSFEG